MAKHWHAPRCLSITLSAALLLATTSMAMAAPAWADPDPQQTLRVTMDGPLTLDPQVADDADSQAVIGLLFEGLLKLDKDGKLAPAVAKEVPSLSNGGVSEDGLVYTYLLRNDVKYSDGKPVTARDFEFAMKRTLEPGLQETYSPSYYTITGAEAYNTSKETDPVKLSLLRDEVGVKATDDSTLVITLDEPRASFNYLTTLTQLFPVREEIVNSQTQGGKPDSWARDARTLVGNGPFKLVEWKADEHIYLAANDQYYGPKAKLQRINIGVGTDLKDDYDSFVKGDLEIGSNPSELDKKVMADPVLSKQLVRFVKPSTTMVVFNVNKAPFDDVRVRQAFSTAVDREGYVEKMGNGIGKPAYSWIPPSMPGYQADLGTQYAMNPETSKQLLSDAGYGEGAEFPTTTFVIGRGDEQNAAFLQKNWKDNLGIDIEVKVLSSAEMDRALEDGSFGLVFSNWSADYPDPDNWIPLFASENGFNVGGYSNEALDGLMRKAVVEQDDATRMEMWAQAQTTIVDDAPAIFLFNPERFRLVKPYVKGIAFGVMDPVLPGARSYGQVWIEKH